MTLQSTGDSRLKQTDEKSVVRSFKYLINVVNVIQCQYAAIYAALRTAIVSNYEKFSVAADLVVEFTVSTGASLFPLAMFANS